MSQTPTPDQTPRTPAQQALDWVARSLTNYARQLAALGHDTAAEALIGRGQGAVQEIEAALVDGEKLRGVVAELQQEIAMLSHTAVPAE